MPPEIQTALISAAVAFFTASISGYFTWSQIRRERSKWLIDLKSSYSIELYKTRLENYPKVYTILAKLSHYASEPVTPDKAKQIGRELNDWFYSVGGLCADVNTRAALLGLRDACLSWTQGDKPLELDEWRDATMLMLRRDLDLEGLESFKLKNRESLLQLLKAEASTIK